MEEARIERTFYAKAKGELAIASCGYSFLTIYGQHINGWFLCMPGWNVSCELANPADDSSMNYNKDKLAEALRKTGWGPKRSYVIAEEILGAIYEYENIQEGEDERN